MKRFINFSRRVESDPSVSLSKTKPYDWTYTSVYPGHLSEPDRFSFIEQDKTNPAHVIPIAELSRQDPILFYAEVPLYEDELHDNGMSQITVRVVSPYAVRFIKLLLKGMSKNRGLCQHHSFY